eukprot:6531523-Prymnesium_polylepis.1
MSAASLADMTGMPIEEAEALLEATGGNLDVAIGLYFDGGAPMAVSRPPSDTAPQHPAHTVLFGSASAPPAWLDQGFEFSSNPLEACGIVQHANGPCGVLAVVNATLIAEAGRPAPTQRLGTDALAGALATILLRC